MKSDVNNIVIVGGGTAGWLTAAVLASHFDTSAHFTITLIESPNIKTIGVGEGTWPTMAATLRRIGISEAQFIAECDASFKQGSRFFNWRQGTGESYYHPFSFPLAYNDINIVDHWLESDSGLSFDEFVSNQTSICNRHLAPKQVTTPEYANVVNYGYHLNAGKFANLLTKHAVERLGVKHIKADVTSVKSDNTSIQALLLDNGQKITADLFIDCTGFKRLLIGQALGVEYRSHKDVLFNDRAMAFQVPYADSHAPIHSTTHATAHSNGWIWDIALPTRRGIGIVYASDYGDESQALATIEGYIKANMPHCRFADLTPNKITIDPGHLSTFWKGNCVAIGLSAGFIDPLEATAMVLIEFSAKFLTQHLPAGKNQLGVIARKFNQRMDTHWRNIIDFIKLHYVLSQRDDNEYWRNHRDPTTIPSSLQDALLLWETRAPWQGDIDMAESMFSPASYQYILYGMGFRSSNALATRRLANNERAHLAQLMAKKAAELQKLQQHLPTNRKLIDHIRHSWTNRP